MRTYVEIYAQSSQTISGNPDILLRGGASGGATNGFGNTVSILSASAASDVQRIDAHNLTIQGGSGGIGNYAVIGTYVTGQKQIITATGAVSITGGAGVDAGAMVRSFGNLTAPPWNPSNDVDITLNATGPITLTAGSGSIGSEGTGGIALIGAIAGHNANVTINGQSGISLIKGAVSNNAMIGSDTGGGTLVIKSGLGGAATSRLTMGLSRRPAVRR